MINEICLGDQPSMKQQRRKTTTTKSLTSFWLGHFGALIHLDH